MMKIYPWDECPCLECVDNCESACVCDDGPMPNEEVPNCDGCPVIGCETRNWLSQ